MRSSSEWESRVSRKKVTVIGAGNVGATAAQEIARRDYDVVVVDIKEGLPQGKALDLNEAGPVLGYEPAIVGTNSYEETEGLDIIVLTAGVPRTGDMSRDDLVTTNEGIVASVTREAVQRSSDAVLIVVSNPLDAMCHVAKDFCGWTRERVFGMAGILDTARFRTFIAWETGASPKDVQTIVLGGHGDQMVLIVSATTVGGVPPAQARLGRAHRGDGRAHAQGRRRDRQAARHVRVVRAGRGRRADGGQRRARPEARAALHRVPRGRVRHRRPVHRGSGQAGAGGIEEIVELELGDDERAELHARPTRCARSSASSRNASLRPKQVLVALVALGAIVGLLLDHPSDHYLYLPDPAYEVDPLVRVPDEDPARRGRHLHGRHLLVRRASLFERLFPQVHDGAELIPEEEFNPAGLSETQRRQESLSEMSASQQIAIAVAPRRLGHDVESLGAEVATVLADAPAAGKLEVGDVIVGAKGEEVSLPEDLFEVMSTHTPGTPRSVRRSPRRTGARDRIDDARLVRRRAPCRRRGHGPARASLPGRRRDRRGQHRRPSAGLAFALDIYDELGEDIDRGRRIVVTGTLDLDGRVGPIGGIEQKTLGARAVDADVFLVPDLNAEAARRRADDDVQVIPASFQEALSALTTQQLSS